MGLWDERAALEGKVALIGGGGGGLGRAISLDLARVGMAVAVCDRDEAALEATMAQLEAMGADCIGAVVDVRSHDALEAFFARVAQRWGALDVLVNVAGGTFKGAFADSTPKGRDALIRTNFMWVMDACHMAIPMMRASGRGGSIINITTIECHRAAPGFAVYSAMKAAVEQFSRTVAIELAPEGIRINNVAPDMTPTEGIINIGASAATDANTMLDPKGAKIAIPMGRTGVPEDISNSVLFLASGLSSYITGCTLHPDGGALTSSGWFNWPETGFGNTVPREVLDKIN